MIVIETKTVCDLCGREYDPKSLPSRQEAPKFTMRWDRDYGVTGEGKSFSDLCEPCNRALARRVLVAIADAKADVVGDDK